MSEKGASSQFRTTWNDIYKEKKNFIKKLLLAVNI